MSVPSHPVTADLGSNGQAAIGSSAASERMAQLQMPSAPPSSHQIHLNGAVSGTRESAAVAAGLEPPFQFGLSDQQSLTASPLRRIPSTTPLTESTQSSPILPISARRTQRPQLSSITTALPLQAPAQRRSSRGRSFTAPTDATPIADSDALINKIGSLLHNVVSVATDARDHFERGKHTQSSMCVTELRLMLQAIGEIGDRSMVNMSNMVPESSQQSPLSADESKSGSNNSSCIILPPESPGVRKRPPMPQDEMPMKTMRGQDGHPVEPPAPPPSAPPALTGAAAEGVKETLDARKGFEPLRPPTLLHTSSSPLVPQVKHIATSTSGQTGPGPSHVQAQTWHDPGSGALSNGKPGVTSAALQALSAQSLAMAHNASALSMPPLLQSSTFQSLPGSPHLVRGTGAQHSRTLSLLDEAFPASAGASPSLSQVVDEDLQWIGESSLQSPVDDGAWSPSEDLEDAFTAAMMGHAESGHSRSASSGGIDAAAGSSNPKAVRSLKGATEAPDMPGRGAIPPLPTHIQEQLDALFYQFLRWVCSNNDCTDSKGESIHQTLMPKRMSRLDHSADYRPFKFRIQAFVNRWQDEVYRNGITEDDCSPKRLRQYLWTQPYISRFNEDGRKAKSKGNHVWIVEGRKLSETEWHFQKFERKIVGPVDKAATVGSPWTWILRVWDPQMSAASIKPVFTVKAKPDWLKFVDGEDNVEKSLVGTPDASSQGGTVAVTAQCLHPNGTTQILDMSFELQVMSIAADGTTIVTHGTTTSPKNELEDGSIAEEKAIPIRSVDAVVPPESILRQQQAQQELQRQQQQFFASLPTQQPTQSQMMMMPPPPPSSQPQQQQGMMLPPSMPAMQPASQAETSAAPPAATPFFAAPNYPFTPPEALTSQPSLFFTDAQGDSPMVNLSNPFGSMQSQTPQPGFQQMQQQQQPQAFVPPPQLIAQSVPQVLPPTAPLTQGQEPHDQVTRRQVQALIQHMNQDQTNSIMAAMAIPEERRKSQTAQHMSEAATAATNNAAAGGGMQSNQSQAQQAGQQQAQQQQYQAQQQQLQAEVDRHQQAFQAQAEAQAQVQASFQAHAELHAAQLQQQQQQLAMQQQHQRTPSQPFNMNASGGPNSNSLGGHSDVNLAGLGMRSFDASSLQPSVNAAPHFFQSPAHLNANPNFSGGGGVGTPLSHQPSPAAPSQSLSGLGNLMTTPAALDMDPFGELNFGFPNAQNQNQQQQQQASSAHQQQSQGPPGGQGL